MNFKFFMPHYPFTAGETEAQHDDICKVVSPAFGRQSAYKVLFFLAFQPEVSRSSWCLPSLNCVG